MIFPLRYVFLAMMVSPKCPSYRKTILESSPQVFNFFYFHTLGNISPMIYLFVDASSNSDGSPHMKCWIFGSSQHLFLCYIFSGRGLMTFLLYEDLFFNSRKFNPKGGICYHPTRIWRKHFSYSIKNACFQPFSFHVIFLILFLAFTISPWKIFDYNFNLVFIPLCMSASQS